MFVAPCVRLVVRRLSLKISLGCVGRDDRFRSIKKRGKRNRGASVETGWIKASSCPAVVVISRDSAYLCVDTFTPRKNLRGGWVFTANQKLKSSSPEEAELQVADPLWDRHLQQIRPLLLKNYKRLSLFFLSLFGAVKVDARPFAHDLTIAGPRLRGSQF